jgi:hypothetical protein
MTDPSTICVGILRHPDGRRCALAHLQDRYGRGACGRPLQIFAEIADQRYPVPRLTKGLWLSDWCKRVTLEEVAEVLDETIMVYDRELGLKKLLPLLTKRQRV